VLLVNEFEIIQESLKLIALNINLLSEELSVRVARVILLGNYLSLATTGQAGKPWVAYVQYAWNSAPLSFIFESAVTSRHATDLLQNPTAAGAISLLPAAHGCLDGIQVTGTCAQLQGERLSRMRRLFYTQIFPDPDVGMAYEQLERHLTGNGLFELRVEQLWVLDLQRWETEQISARTEVDPLTIAPRLLAMEGHVG
jgi:uncharacterized protein YhbP (UPF0306 family)